MKSQRSNFVLFRYLLVVSFILASLGKVAWAAPCCSGSNAAPSLISGDEMAQMSMSYGFSEVTGIASENGNLQTFGAGLIDRVQTYRVDSALLVSDSWQVGASVPIVSRGLSSYDDRQSYTSIGDIRLTTAYEAFPLWSYSSWKPRGFLFLQTTLPTGRSVHESIRPLNVDAVGRGFYQIAVGGMFVKRWGDWDAYWMPEAHWILPRTFDQENVSFGHTWGASAGLGVGISPWGSNLRLGFRLQPIYSAPREVQIGLRPVTSHYQFNWDTTFEAAYLLAENWTLAASYTDQALIGPTVNSTFSKIASVSLQHRWDR